jgi:hypothetical protein
MQALVPVLFFLARIWGSLRILIYAFAGDNAVATSSADGWMHTMQAIFDPSQGFLNALLFVFLSSKNMNSLGNAITSSRCYVACRKSTVMEGIMGKYDPSQKAEVLKEGGSDSDISESSIFVSAVGGGGGKKNGISMPLLSDEEDQSDYDSYYSSERPSQNSRWNA